MANTRSALKMIRVAERRRLRNRPIRSAIRTYLRRFQQEVAAGHVEGAQAAARRAVSALDKAATKGVIHKNNASRHKSRLMIKLNRLLAGAAEAAPQKAPAAAGPEAAGKRTARAKKVGKGG